MHSGGAQTTLRNNRKLLKKRVPTHKKFKRWRSLSDDKYKRTPDKSLITLSASERRSYGKKIKRRRNVEFIVIMAIVIVIIYFGIKLIGVPVELSISSNNNRSNLDVKVALTNYEINNKLTQEEVLENSFKSYVDFGDYFYNKDQFSQAIKSYNKALKLKPENKELKEVIALSKVEYKAQKDKTGNSRFAYRLE